MSTSRGPKPFKPPRPASSISAPKASSKVPEPPSKIAGGKRVPPTFTTSKPKTGATKAAARLSASSKRRVVADESDDEEEGEGDSLEVSEEEDIEGEQVEEQDIDDPFASQPQARSRNQQSSSSRPSASQVASTAEPHAAEALEDDDEREVIPKDLITRLLHEFMNPANATGGGLRISKGANSAVGFYLDTFVREAVARGVYEMREKAAEDGVGGDFLEVEDLEKLAPQLILDF